MYLVPFDPARWLSTMAAAGYRVALWHHGGVVSLTIAFPDRPASPDPLPLLAGNAFAVVEILTVRRLAQNRRRRSPAARRASRADYRL